MSLDKTVHQSDEELHWAKQQSANRTRPPADLPGYEPQRFLGQGAYGEVWVAVDQNTGRRVAVKFYTRGGGMDWSLLAREVEKLVFLSADRYVVQLLDVGWDADPPYYVMEYVENGSLDALLRETGPLPVVEAVSILRDVATGLMHAHAKGVLHCDLKPANVLLDQERKARLADFGQSRLSTEQTPALGTLFYMAPEQADLKAVPDAAWDVYALGALLYCMLTGEPPHRHDAATDEIEAAGHIEERLTIYRRRIRRASVPTDHRKIPGVDRALAEIIERCLAPKPGDRYQSVQAVVDAMEARERVRARRPLLVLGFVGPALLMLVMLLFGWRTYHEATTESAAAVTQRVVESNRFAAENVAVKVSHEIDRYFRAVEEIARRPEFQDLVAAVLADEELAPLIAQLGDPAGEEELVQQQRQEFLAHPKRKALQQRMDAILREKRFPSAASWFVTDDVGLHLASTFQSTPQRSPVGRYYGWRTYFHGGEEDIPKEQRGSLTLPPIGKTHLSAVFKSTATYTWKVAVSTPVVYEGRFLGVLALTAELGGFVEFKRGDTQFAVLVDGRPGQSYGVILQHPLFDKLLERDGRLPERLSALRAPVEQLEDSDAKYYDPMGGDVEGAAYSGPWIAAQAHVRLVRGRSLSRGGQETQDTGLMVVVQEDYDSAIAPVQQLGRWLLREAILALALLLIVALALWYFVSRLMRDPVRRLRGKRGGSGPPTSTQTATAGSMTGET